MPGQWPRHWGAAITGRLRSANTYAVDSALAAVVAVPVSVQFANASPGPTPLGVLLNAGTVLPLIWRRRAPFAVAVTVAVFAALVSVYNRPGQDVPYGALLATYTVADLGRRWQRWSFFGGLVLFLGPGALLVKHYGAAGFLFDLLLPLSAYLLGTLARTSRERAEALKERAEQLARGRAADVRSQQTQQDRQATTVILGLALIYALIAVANTLVMAASGRRREIAALSLAGATRRQALRFIAAESALVVLIGAILAAGAASVVVAGQWAALTRLSADVPVSIPWLPIGAITAGCAAVAVLASVLPAWRVLRTRVVELADLRE